MEEVTLQRSGSDHSVNTAALSNQENVPISDENNSGKTRPRRKDVKSVEQLLKGLGDVSAEKKIDVLASKLAQVLEENKAAQTKLKAAEKTQQALMKDKENLQAEHSKAVLSRSRMESLCRELQRQNKAVKEESLCRSREEEERRKEVSNKFQSTLNEVTVMLQQNNDRNAKLREENTEMAAKLKLLCDQYALREQQVEKLAKEYDLERQLNATRVAKLCMEAADDKEVMLREKQSLLLELTATQKKCQTLQHELISVRSQLTLYTEKYEEFQETLSSSNKTFNGFKEQMDKMTKRLKSLERETADWKRKWESSNQALVQLAAEKQTRDAELASTLKKTTQLEKLCRVLQMERNELQTRLRSESSAECATLVEADTTGRGESAGNPEINGQVPSSPENVIEAVTKQIDDLKCGGEVA